jgi:hypothetical protein
MNDDECPMCWDLYRVTYGSRGESRPDAHCSKCHRRIPSRVVFEAPFQRRPVPAPPPMSEGAAA